MGKRLVVETDARKIAVPAGPCAPLVFDENPHAARLLSLDPAQYLGDAYACARDVPPLDALPAVVVDTEEALAHAVAEASRHAVLAVDVEHHSFMSYHGLTCVVQLSAGGRDYVLDAIRLRQTLGPALRPLLEDPAYLKVLHSADSDLQWLQRDLGLFVVGHFDTAAACRALGAERRGLGALLEQYFGVALDKSNQLADWRVRPLPEDMVSYARADTHYLPHLWARMAGELGADRTAEVLRLCFRSAARTLWRPETPSPNAWRAILPAGVGHGGLEVRRASQLWAWRDAVARARDVSPPAVAQTWELARMVRAAPSRWRSMLRGVADAEWAGLAGPPEVAPSECAPAVPAAARPRQHIIFSDSPDGCDGGCGPTVDGRAAGAGSDACGGGAVPCDGALAPEPCADTSASTTAQCGGKSADMAPADRPADAIAQCDGQADAGGEVAGGPAPGPAGDHRACAKRPRTVRVGTSARASAMADAFGGVPSASLSDGEGRAQVAAAMGISRAMRAAAALEASRQSDGAGAGAANGADAAGGEMRGSDGGSLDTAPIAALPVPDPRAIELVRPGARILLSAAPQSAATSKACSTGCDSSRPTSLPEPGRSSSASVSFATPLCDQPSGVDLAAEAAKLYAQKDERAAATREGAAYRPGRAAMPRSAARAMSFRRR